ncbi:MAG: S41 family peptidase [Planctomycetes bacterium]|nr:S41 family peptidase [Planctomycetota bacterium]MCP4839503.1 S41 family peptidase [Planctomycetota bacterium]
MLRHATCTPLASILAIVVLGGTSSILARPVSHEARAWADDVWEAALEGDRTELDELFATPASSGVQDDARKRFIQAVEAWRSHEVEDRTHVTERMAEAKSEMLAAEADGDMLEALRLLIEVQALSKTLGAPLADPHVQEFLDAAEAQINTWIGAKEYFNAQQGLLRLRAVYEDTGHQEDWDRLTKAYELLWDKLRLLRRYRFDEYHKLYVSFHRSQGDEVSEEYSPRLDTRWQDMIRDVDIETAARAIHTAAAEHVESEGLVPLLDGGIDAIRTLTQDDVLAETFPSLGDEALLASWHAALDATDASIEIPGADVSLVRTMQRIAQANADTIALPEGVLWREFADGAMNRLDRFSQVIWPYDYESFRRQMQGNFIGVGVQIQETDLGEIKVVTPLEGKPAFYAGVRADDIIASVNGQSTAGWTVQDAVHHITGPEDTEVTLGLRRNGEDGLVEVPIVRAIIRMPNVKGWRKEGVDDAGRESWDWMISPDQGIGYIKLTGFDQETQPDLQRAMRDMRNNGPLNGLVLDLRHNPGGLLDLAGFVSNLFVPRGEIVTGEDSDGRQTFCLSARSHACLLGGVPTVVLINRGSASASEIVAGCLQAHEAAVVLGERSFGKGSVQTVHPLAAEARIKVTNQYYRLPSVDGNTPGRLVHKRPGSMDWGVVPDLEVRMSMDDIIASERLRFRAERAVSDIPLPEPPEPDPDAEPNPADEGPPNIARLIDDGFDPQLELAVLLVSAQVLAETESDATGTLDQVAEGPIEDLRSRAGGR